MPFQIKINQDRTFQKGKDKYSFQPVHNFKFKHFVQSKPEGGDKMKTEPFYVTTRDETLKLTTTIFHQLFLVLLSLVILARAHYY